MTVLEPVVCPVMLSLQPVVLAIMTVGIAGIVCRCGRCKRGGRDRECRREEILTHLSLLFLDPRKLREVR